MPKIPLKHYGKHHHEVDILLRWLRPIQLASFIGHLFLTPNQHYTCSDLVGEQYMSI
jgi:hypothetical protein